MCGGSPLSINYSEPHPLGKYPDVYRLQFFSSFVVNRRLILIEGVVVRTVLQKKKNNNNNKEVSESLYASLHHSEAVQSGIQNLARNRKTKPKLYIRLNNI